MPELVAAIKFQAVVFTPDMVVGSTQALGRRVQDLLRARFAAVNLVSAVPTDAPAEVPRVLCLGTEPGWTLQMSLARTDIVYDPLVGAPEAEHTSFRAFLDRASDIIGPLHEGLALSVDRLAAIYEDVNDVSADEGGSPAAFVSTRLMRELRRENGQPVQAEAHWMHRVEVAGRQVNRWIRVKALEFMQPPQLQGERLLFHCDVNSLHDPEHRTIFTMDQIRASFAAMDGVKDQAKRLVFGG